jgi:hypothetical protein
MVAAFEGERLLCESPFLPDLAEDDAKEFFL